MILYVSRLVLVLAALPGVVAQTSTNANCTDNLFKWVFNSNGQSPCRVAEILADQCDPQGFVILPLDPGAIYPGPTMDENNPCHCNTVLYSLMCGCAACQDRSWITLTEYAQNCTSLVYGTVYPGGVPSDASVPHWAYLNVTATNDTFDVNAAFIASEPQSTNSAAATAGSVTSTPVSAPTSTPVPENLVVTVGAIIGSVGSVVGVLALSITVMRWIFRRLQESSQVDARALPMVPLPPLPSTSPLISPMTLYSSDVEFLLTLDNPDDPTNLPPEEPSILQTSSRVDPQGGEISEPVMNANDMGSATRDELIPRRTSS